MSDEGHGRRIALLVRDRPFRRRAARTDLDTALTAAAMDFGIEVYFLGDSVLQLASRRDTAAALLPVGHRGWAALQELTEIQAFAEREHLARIQHEGLEWLLPLRALDATEMAARWRGCSRALML